MTEPHRKILEKVDRLAKSGNVPAAIDLLKPVAESGNAEVPLLATLGELYEASGDLGSAAKWYRQAIDLAGADAGKIPGNLRTRFGVVLFQLKRDQEAIPELEKGWRTLENPGDALLTFKILAEAYERTGALNEARSANLAVLSSYPSSRDAWAALTRLKASFDAKAQQELRENVPAPPRIDEFSTILKLGDPWQWTINELSTGIAAYVKYAEVIKGMNRPLSAGNARRVAALMALKVGEDSLNEGRPADSIRAFALLEQAQSIDTLKPDIQRSVYRDLVLAHLREEQYVHGIAAFEKLTKIPSTESEHFQDRELLMSLLRAVFDSVSWNPKTLQLRENDPDDFVEVNPPEPGRPTPSPSPKAKRVEAPYGMASPDEDSATIGTRIGVFRRDFDELLMLRIRQKNFELPVKDLLHQLWAALTGFFSYGIDDMYVKALDQAIEEAGDNVSETTLDAYTVAKRTMALFPKPSHRGSVK
ncbi:MAG: hypothetical protein AABM67_06835 [Acidobacteriota bacterium]